jgi:hypothetical protein
LFTRGRSEPSSCVDRTQRGKRETRDTRDTRDTRTDAHTTRKRRIGQGSEYQHVARGEVVVEEGRRGLGVEVEQRLGRTEGDLHSLQRRQRRALLQEHIVEASLLHPLAHLRGCTSIGQSGHVRKE